MKKKKKKKLIKICPKCGSINIGHTLTLAFPSMPVGGPQEFCRDCSYGRLIGETFFPEIDRLKIEEFRKKLEKNG